MKQNGFNYVTPIQEKVIEAGIMDGRSMIITAESGSGKTLSYLLPVINQLNLTKDQKEMELGITHEEEIEKVNKGFFRFNGETEDQMF